MEGMKKMRNDMVFKWAAIPYVIFVILVAGACYNLFAYFQQIGAAMGYGKGTMTTIKYTVLFGYYLGLIPGAIVRFLSPLVSFIIAGVLTLVSFTGLGILAEYGTGTGIQWGLMIFLLFIGSMSGSIATMAAIVTSVKSFPEFAGILILVITLSYYKIAPYLEFSIRSGFFEEPSLMWYFIGLGGAMCLIFIIAAFVIKEVTFSESVEKVLSDYDRLGLLAYVLTAALLFGSFFVVALVYNNWLVGAILFITFIVINFFVIGGAFTVVYNQLKANWKSIRPGFGKRKDPTTFEELLQKPKYIALVFATFLVVGVGATFNFNVFQIAFAFGDLDSADNLLDTFWACDMMARFGGGLLAYFLYETVNAYWWAIGGSISVAVGFGICLLAEAIGTSFLFIGGGLIAFGVGYFWVIVPIIVMNDARESHFGLNWGLTLFANALGICIFGELFDLVYEWKGDGADTCEGTKWVVLQFIFFGILALIATGLTWYALSKDNEETPKDEKAGKGGKGDKGGKGGRKSKGDKEGRKSKGDKDKKDRSGRSKSKDKKERSGRSKSKGRDKSDKKGRDKSDRKKSSRAK